jgi:hypothetical protein
MVKAATDAAVRAFHFYSGFVDGFDCDCDLDKVFVKLKLYTDEFNCMGWQ